MNLIDTNILRLLYISSMVCNGKTQIGLKIKVIQVETPNDFEFRILIASTQSLEVQALHG